MLIFIKFYCYFSGGTEEPVLSYEAVVQQESKHVYFIFYQNLKKFSLKKGGRFQI